MAFNERFSVFRLMRFPSSGATCDGRESGGKGGKNEGKGIGSSYST